MHRRKSAPKVFNGRVQKKNRWQRTPNCYSVSQPEPVIDRRRPGEGYRHVVSKRDMERFLRIIPEWDKIAVGLDVVLVDTGGRGCMGWFRPGLVAVCAWERELDWYECTDEFFTEHCEILDKLGATYKYNGDISRYRIDGESTWTVDWTVNLARAFLLTHVFLFTNSAITTIA